MKEWLKVSCVAGVLLSGAPVLAEGPDIAAMTAQIDALHAERDKRATEEQAAVDAALAAAPENFEVVWRAARWSCWQADGLDDDKSKEQKAILGKRCWEQGEKATKLDAKRVEGFHYAAEGVGHYSNAVGILKALTNGLEGTFNGFLDKALAMNPYFNNGAPLVTKGRYFWSLPWPKRDLKKSAELLNKCIEKQPKQVRCQLYLADTLLKDGDAQAAKALVEAVKSHQVGAFDAPEERRIKARLPNTEKRVEEELK